MALVQAPFESMTMLALAWHETSALRVALDMKLYGHIPLSGEILLDVLTQKVGGSKDLIVCVLGALANSNCFVETSPSHYAHTVISATLTFPSLNAFINHSSVDNAYNSSPHLADVTKENNFVTPDNASKAASNRAFKTNKPFFDYIYSDSNPSRAERFGLGQKPTSMMGYFPQNAYTPLLNLPTGTTVCDFGGGLGQASITMAKTCLGPKFIVQDQEIVITQAVTNIAQRN